jgi:hypothetical protein
MKRINREFGLGIRIWLWNEWCYYWPFTAYW